MKYDKVYINCYNRLNVFDSKEKAKEFFATCYYSSEGSEKERYSNILMDLNFMNTPCFSDGDKDVLYSDINFNEIDRDVLLDIKEYFKLDDTDLTILMAENKLNSISKKVYNLNSYESFEDYYIQSKEKTDKYYLISRDINTITCFDIYDTNIKGNDSYYCEDFELNDYEFAYRWLANEIEIDEYYSHKRKTEMEIEKEIE